VALAEVGPSSCVHCFWNVTKSEMVTFLVVLHLSGFIERNSLLRVISELCLSNGGVVVFHFTNLKMCRNLVQGVLISELPISRHSSGSLLWHEGFLVLRNEAFLESRVVFGVAPMRGL